MKKNFKITITFSIIAIFTLFSLLCCCLTKIAQADTAEVFTYQKIIHQEEITSETHPSENHKDCQKKCDQDKFLSIIPNSLLNDLKFKLSSYQNYKLLFAQGSVLNYFLRIYSFSNVKQGLPGKPQNTVPIYLQYSILRI